jgi:hypothetical protein
MGVKPSLAQGKGSGQATDPGAGNEHAHGDASSSTKGCPQCMPELPRPLHGKRMISNDAHHTDLPR